MENVDDDDFGELYADVGAPAVPDVSPQVNNENETAEKSAAGDGEEERSEGERVEGTNEEENGVVGVLDGDGYNEEESEESEDDFELVVNYDDEDDGEGRRVNLDGGKDCGDNEAEEIGEEEVEGIVGGGPSGGETREEREKGVGNGGVNVNCKNNGNNVGGVNLQNKYGRGQFRRGGLGSGLGLGYGGGGGWGSGSNSGFGDNVGGFWLPWYRTIFDVDIDNFEHKPWMFPGADVTDYFNFGFDEEGWKQYCRSMDLVRQQSFRQSRNQFSGNFISKRPTETRGGLESQKFVDEESTPAGFMTQIGQPILVEDSNIERLPSVDTRPPRDRDSDVVIQITMQDPEGDSNSLKDPNGVLETAGIVSRDEGDLGNIDPGIPDTAGSIASDGTTNEYVEEAVRSPHVSSDLKRSYDSPTASSHMLQECSSLTKHDADSDIQQSKTVDTVCGRHARAVDTLDNSVEDADRNTSETNPCVAGIDSLSYDHLQFSSPTYSDTDTRSGSSIHGDGYDCEVTVDHRRRSSVGRNQTANHDQYLPEKSDRENIKMNYRSVNKSPRSRGSCEEERKHQELQGLSKQRSHIEDDKYHNCTADHFSRRDRSRSYHHGHDDERQHDSFHQDDRLSYKKSFRGCYDDSFTRNFDQDAELRDPHQGAGLVWKDRMTSHSQRKWTDNGCVSERRMLQKKDDILERKWHLEQRECFGRDEAPLSGNRPHFTSKASSIDMDRWDQQSHYNNVHSIRRKKYPHPLEYDSPLDRHPRFNSLKGSEREYLHSDTEYEKDAWDTEREVGESGREDHFFENPCHDGDYPRIVEDEYWDRGISPPIPENRGRHLAYSERSHGFTLYRDEVDECRFSERLGRHTRCISPLIESDDRHFYDHVDAYDRHDTVRYLDVDDYLVEKDVMRIESRNWTEDALSYRCINDDFHDGAMLDSFESASMYNRHDSLHKIGPDEMGMPTQNFKHYQRLVESGAGDKYVERSSNIRTRLTHDQTALSWRNSVEVRHFVRERKATGNRLRVGSRVHNDAFANADGRFQKLEKKQWQDERAEALQTNRSLVMKQNHLGASDLEDGQIPTEEPFKENFNKRKYGLAHMAEHGSLKRANNQNLTRQNVIAVYDESQILQTMAKMEKRRERFKNPVLLEKETDSDPKPQVLVPVGTTESKQQRPTRKRRWGGS